MPDIPRTMAAVLLKGVGGFEQLEFREDVPVPVPMAGEVLIRVGAAAVNNTDINTRTAWYSRSVIEGTTADGAAHGYAEARAEDAGWTGSAPTFPRIQGADACGRIVAVGDDVDAARIGERVLIEPVLRATAGGEPHRATYFGSECDGAFAEFTKVPAINAHKVDSSLSDAELACFPCAYSAAENMLTRAALAATDTVLITGASGGVGSAAVQLARLRGARVWAVASHEKAAQVRALGATSIVAREADLIASMGREAVDVVIDVVGGKQFPQLIELLKRGGRYAVAGAIAGPVVPLDLRMLYLKDLRLLGCTILEDGVFARLIFYIERGKLKPLIARSYPLRAIVEAQKEFLRKQHLGKIVLSI